jgi:3-hydroxybutyryl-CoA dehydratase
MPQHSSSPARGADLQLGDALPAVTKTETQESIDAYAELASPGRPRLGQSLHSDEDFARRTIFAGTVNLGVATMAYCHEVLEQAFPVEALLRPGSRVEFKAIEPIRAGDTVTITGAVTGRREEADHLLIDCELRVVNQQEKLCGIATATVVLT